MKKRTRNLIISSALISISGIVIYKLNKSKVLDGDVVGEIENTNDSGQVASWDNQRLKENRHYKKLQLK